MEGDTKIGKNRGSAKPGDGMWLTLKTSPFPICVTASNFVVFCQRMYVEIEKNPQN